MESLLLPFFYILVILYSVTIHEVSHGLMANSLGDPTAKNLGRLSLNPIKHMDLFGSVILPLLLLFMRTGFIFGYAKPVPYNPLNLSDRRFGAAKVAIAGPLSNIALALLFGLSLRFMPDVLSSPLVPELLEYIIKLNLVLALFNLFPFPPLDGHWLLMTFLPNRFNSVKIFLYKYNLPILLIFMFFIFPLFYPVIGFFFRIITGVGL